MISLLFVAHGYKKAPKVRSHCFAMFTGFGIFPTSKMAGADADSSQPFFTVVGTQPLLAQYVFPLFQDVTFS